MSPRAVTAAPSRWGSLETRRSEVCRHDRPARVYPAPRSMELPRRSPMSRSVAHGPSLLLPLIALAIGAPAPVSHATITPDAAKVVDRYVAAIGGRAAVAAQQSLHIKTTITAFGFKGSIESWVQRPRS